MDGGGNEGISHARHLQQLNQLRSKMQNDMSYQIKRLEESNINAIRATDQKLRDLNAAKDEAVRKKQAETAQKLNASHLAEIQRMNTQNELQRKKFQDQIRRLNNDLQTVKAELNEKEAENRRLKDPRLIEKNNRAAFEQLLRQLPEISAEKKIPKSHGFKYAVVMGENSAGKSSIYNHFLGCTEWAGLDDTTQEVSMVKTDTDRGIAYFDSPGINHEVDVTNLQSVQLYSQIDIVFIVTAVTFKFSRKAIEIMNHINPSKFFLVRNQCDRFETDQQLQKAYSKDLQLLESWGIYKQILLISSRRGDDYRDNARFKRILLGEE